jgi:sterol desaturase/sphingolipid hydroxylase (fatty acid hydroxylase superfamily)
MAGKNWDQIVFVLRLFIISAILLSFVFVKMLDLFVEEIWRILFNSPVVRLDTFEPVLSTISFFTWINMFRIVDLYNMFPAYRIHPSEKAESHWLGPQLSKCRSIPRLLRPITFFVPESWRGLAAVAYLSPLFLFDMIYPRRKLPEQAPSFHVLIGSVCCSIFAYDFVFYWIHYAMHHVKGLYYLHKTHHSSESMCAAEVIHHGLIDGTLQVQSVPSMSSRITSPALILHLPAQNLYRNLLLYSWHPHFNRTIIFASPFTPFTTVATRARRPRPRRSPPTSPSSTPSASTRSPAPSTTSPSPTSSPRRTAATTCPGCCTTWPRRGCWEGPRGTTRTTAPPPRTTTSSSATLTTPCPPPHAVRRRRVPRRAASAQTLNYYRVPDWAHVMCVTRGYPDVYCFTSDVISFVQSRDQPHV